MNKYYPYLVTICNKDDINNIKHSSNEVDRCLIKADSIEEAAGLIKPYVSKTYEIVSIERFNLPLIEHE